MEEVEGREKCAGGRGGVKGDSIFKKISDFGFKGGLEQILK